MECSDELMGIYFIGQGMVKKNSGWSRSDDGFLRRKGGGMGVGCLPFVFVGR